MSVALTTWFANWSAQRDRGFKLPPSKKHRRRSHTCPARTCIACGERQISRGKSNSGVYARKAGLCVKCYHGDG